MPHAHPRSFRGSKQQSSYCSVTQAAAFAGELRHPSLHDEQELALVRREVIIDGREAAALRDPADDAIEDKRATA